MLRGHWGGGGAGKGARQLWWVISYCSHCTGTSARQTNKLRLSLGCVRWRNLSQCISLCQRSQSSGHRMRQKLCLRVLTRTKRVWQEFILCITTSMCLYVYSILSWCSESDGTTFAWTTSAWLKFADKVCAWVPLKSEDAWLLFWNSISCILKRTNAAVVFYLLTSSADVRLMRSDG